MYLVGFFLYQRVKDKKVFFLASIVKVIDNINDTIGRAVSWLTFLMVLIVFTVVLLRYVFSVGWIAMQESYVWIHGTVFMLSASYTFLHDSHVRIDVIYRSASKTYKALVNFLGSIFFVLPVIWITWIKAIPFVNRSWGRLESSAEAGGLPGLYLLKSIILIFCILFALQAISLALRSLCELLGVDVPRVLDEHNQQSTS